MGKGHVDCVVLFKVGTLLSELAELVSAGEEQRITETEVRYIEHLGEWMTFSFSKHACQIFPLVVSVLHPCNGQPQRIEAGSPLNHNRFNRQRKTRSSQSHYNSLGQPSREVASTHHRRHLKLRANRTIS